jgi:hypothetical protein
MKTIDYIKVILVCAGLVLTSSCSILQGLDPTHRYYVEKTLVTKQIADLNAQHASDIQAATTKVSTDKDAVIGSLEKQLQSIANSLYGANTGFKFYEKPGRVDLIINNRVTEAQAADGKQPTAEAMLAENKRLSDEMDEQKTTIAQLTKTHQGDVAAAAKLAEEAAKAKTDLDTAKQQVTQVEQTYIAKITPLQTKLNDTNDKLISAEQAKLNQQAETEKLKKQLMLWCGIGALLFLVGAVYSPVGKEGLAILAGVCAGAAVAIPFITGTIILVSALLIFLVLVVYFLRKHHIAEKTTTNLVNGIEDAKTALGDKASVLTNILKSWNAKYTKTSFIGGNVVTKADDAVEAYIQKKLMASGRLDPKPVAPQAAPQVTPTPPTS